MKRWHVIAATVLVLTGVVLNTGCQTRGANATASIRMLPDGSCVIDGKAVPVSQLQQTLKSAGIGRETRIRIALPPDASEQQIRDLASALSLAGYRLIHFVTPRKASAYVDPAPAGPSRSRR